MTYGLVDIVGQAAQVVASQVPQQQFAGIVPYQGQAGQGVLQGVMVPANPLQMMPANLMAPGSMLMPAFQGAQYQQNPAYSAIVNPAIWQAPPLAPQQLQQPQNAAKADWGPQISGRTMRGQILPIGGFVTVAAGASVTLVAQPQRPMRIDRLVIVGPGLLVTNFQVGADTQFTAAGEIPTDMFGPTAVGMGLRSSTASPGIQVALMIRNPTAGPLTVIASAIGETLD